MDLAATLANHRGPFRFCVIRPHKSKLGFATSEWTNTIKDADSAQEVIDEAVSILNDSRDNVSSIGIFSETEGGFIFSVRPSDIPKLSTNEFAPEDFEDDDLAETSELISLLNNKAKALATFQAQVGHELRFSSPGRGQEKLSGLASFHKPNDEKEVLAILKDGHVYTPTENGTPISEFRARMNFSLVGYWS